MLLFVCCLLSRPKWEGGQYEGDENERQDVLRLAMELGADYVDVELQVTILINEEFWYSEGLLMLISFSYFIFVC